MCQRLLMAWVVPDSLPEKYHHISLKGGFSPFLDYFYQDLFCLAVATDRKLYYPGAPDRWPIA